ncbi:hypothetical protein ACLKA6_008409 [Drosophila palustris]
MRCAAGGQLVNNPPEVTSYRRCPTEPSRVEQMAPKLERSSSSSRRRATAQKKKKKKQRRVLSKEFFTADSNVTCRGIKAHHNTRKVDLWDKNLVSIHLFYCPLSTIRWPRYPYEEILPRSRGCTPGGAWYP